jgi:hypothetical protein
MYSEYRMVHDWRMDKFHAEMDQYLSEGWQLYGLPFTRQVSSSQAEFCQAVVRSKINAPSVSVFGQVSGDK